MRQQIKSNSKTEIMKSNSTQTENMNNTEIAIRFVIAIGIVWLMYNVTLFAN